MLLSDFIGKNDIMQIVILSSLKRKLGLPLKLKNVH